MFRYLKAIFALLLAISFLNTSQVFADTGTFARGEYESTRCRDSNRRDQIQDLCDRIGTDDAIILSVVLWDGNSKPTTVMLYQSSEGWHLDATGYAREQKTLSNGEVIGNVYLTRQISQVVPTELNAHELLDQFRDRGLLYPDDRPSEIATKLTCSPTPSTRIEILIRDEVFMSRSGWCVLGADSEQGAFVDMLFRFVVTLDPVMDRFLPEIYSKPTNQ